MFSLKIVLNEMTFSYGKVWATAFDNSFCFLISETETKLLLIGLGGGILPMFLHRHFPQVMDLWLKMSGLISVAQDEWFNLCYLMMSSLISVIS